MYNYKAKTQNIESLNDYTMLKTLSMFNYFNLPETLNPIFIEKQLQKHGYVFITKVENELYAFHGSMGGVLDVYGEPTTINISNSALNFNKTLDIKKDGVLVKNNDMCLGLYPIIDRHNTLLVENEITMFLSTYNARIQTLISAGDDNTKASAEKYLQKVVDGDLGVIGENRLFDGITAQNTTSNGANDISKIVEFNQYIKASLYNELGLNANFNMKRERLNTSEVEMNSDNLYPLIDNMFLTRLQGINAINEMYGTEIEIDFGSIWKNKSSDGTQQIMDDETDEPIIETDEPIIETDEPEIEPEETIEPEIETEDVEILESEKLDQENAI